MKAENTIICRILNYNKSKLVDLEEEYDNKDSSIVKKDYGFEFHLSVLKEVDLVETYRDVLSVDLGFDKFATCVRIHDPQIHYYGAYVAWSKDIIYEPASGSICC
ncbi:hypothetical protein C9439_05580 [archaeon SCG-AAA382B04]|nr:hypothetical protein C9439_05580 [archaeon SCG-AAA382B04]